MRMRASATQSRKTPCSAIARPKGNLTSDRWHMSSKARSAMPINRIA
jgi:hypothetical protein